MNIKRGIQSNSATGCNEKGGEIHLARQHGTRRGGQRGEGEKDDQDARPTGGDARSRGVCATADGGITVATGRT